jgi:predicted DNA-binding transcriptional regulator YafY
MAWGSHAKVLKPLELQHQIKIELEKTLKGY